MSVESARARFPRVAISHEWLTIPGGSEKVVMAMLDVFPQAELFTTVYDPAPWPAAITSRPVHASFLDRIPGAARHYPKLLPLMDAAFRRFDLSGFDLVLSSNHACAKNVRVPAGVPHVCYCHTPMRYAWDPAFLAGEDLGRVGPARRAGAAAVAAPARSRRLARAVPLPRQLDASWPSGSAASTGATPTSCIRPSTSTRCSASSGATAATTCS